MPSTDLNQATPPNHTAQVQRVLWITLALNLLVCGIKAVVGFWIGSLAVIADAVHSLTDSASNVLALVVTRWAGQPPDADHPYGHQKFEAMGALAIAAMLGIACFELLKSACMRLLSGDAAEVHADPVYLVLLVLVLGVNIFVAVYERRAGRRLNSALLLADSQHTLGDIWITLGVLLGVAGIAFLGWQWLDLALAFPVAGAVLWSGWAVLRSNLPWLVDAAAIPAQQIKELALAVPGVRNCHAVSSRGVPGRQIFVEMHLVTDANDVDAAHRITEDIERRLEQRFGPVTATIHVEPPVFSEPD